MNTQITSRRLASLETVIAIAEARVMRPKSHSQLEMLLSDAKALVALLRELQAKESSR